VIIMTAISVSGTAALGNTEASNPDSLGAMFTEGKVSGVVKALLFTRNFDSDKNDWATLAIGGNLAFETAPVYGLSGGVGFKTGQGDNLDDKDLYSGLLAKGDNPSDAEGYTALDEYFLRYNGYGTDVVLGAFALSSPWMNGFDLRMTPKKYRGVRLVNNSWESLELHGYYITDWLDWTDESWESISSGITGNSEDDEGSFILGLAWKALDNLTLKAWNYYFTDVMNSFYGRLDYSQGLSQDYSFAAHLKYLDQQDIGDSLTGEIDTYMAGVDIGVAGHGAKLTAYYGAVGDDAIENPFGGDYAVQLLNKWLERAEETVWGLKLDYDFKQVGVEGLTAYLFYADFDTPDSGVNASTDHQEIDFNLLYTFGGRLEDLSLRFRYAYVDQDENVGNGNDWDDVRFHIEYRF
jgi:hypothetical protein